MATSTLTPSLAATFASSQGELSFTNFSQPFSISEKQNHGDASPVAKGGVVEAENIHVIINVTDHPASASTSALSQTFGDSKAHSGIAQTQSKIILNFDVDAGKVFSFNFSATLDIQTRIKESSAENAKSSGDISFKLFDTTGITKQNLPGLLSSLLADDTNDKIQNSLLDFFSMTGNLNTPGNNDSIIKEKSQHVTLTAEDKKFSTGGTQESAKSAVKGSFQRSFNKGTNLTLIAVRRTQSKVSGS